MNANTRIQWLHKKMTVNAYPNAQRLAERFGISHRQAQRDLDYLRRELGRTLNLRNTPELTFVRDDSIDHGAHILDMLRDPNVVKPANPANAHIILDEE